ncbi:MAG: hypothetical protein RL536_42 [Candidatus Parcubacteria bacterium]
MKHHQNNIALFVIAISVTVFVYGLYGFMYHSVNNSLEHALAAKEDVKKEQMNKDQGKSLMEAYEMTVKDRAELPKFFVPDSQKVKFIEMLESLGNSTGAKVSISSISADDLAAGATESEGHIMAHMDVEGTWSAIMRTLIYAENLQYKSSVSMVKISAGGSSDAKDPKSVWHLSFVLDTLSIRATN